jgi:alcohol dehydrogenase
MENKKQNAIRLLKEFKGDNYIFGLDCIDQVGELTAKHGKKVSVVALSIGKEWSNPVQKAVKDSLAQAGLQMAGEMIEGAKPDAPTNDVYRMADEIAEQSPDVVVTIGGGSSIDATKAAVAYLTFKDKHPELSDYFGVGTVAQMIETHNRKLLPVVAVQVTAGSAAHLTKYSNITDVSAGQKLLIIDMAVVPPDALFDYNFTASQSADLTMDGGLDGISHCLEVLMGIPQENFEKVKPVSLLGIDLIVNNLKEAVKNPDNEEAREAIGLGTDLGGYAIMIGGTNGAHLNSFSMTDILSHGRACALMNPYYVVFFAPAIENRLREVGKIYHEAGYIRENVDNLSGKDLGMAISEGMRALSEDIGFPTKLSEVKGFTDEHISKCLAAAKNPKLASKLQNMPVPLSADTVDEYMGPILQAAKTGNVSLIKNMQ